MLALFHRGLTYKTCGFAAVSLHRRLILEVLQKLSINLLISVWLNWFNVCFTLIKSDLDIVGTCSLHLHSWTRVLTHVDWRLLGCCGCFLFLNDAVEDVITALELELFDFDTLEAAVVFLSLQNLSPLLFPTTWSLSWTRRHSSRFLVGKLHVCRYFLLMLRLGPFPKYLRETFAFLLHIFIFLQARSQSSSLVLFSLTLVKHDTHHAAVSHNVDYDLTILIDKFYC